MGDTLSLQRCHRKQSSAGNWWPANIATARRLRWLVYYMYITIVRRNVDWAQYGKRDWHWDDTASPSMWLAFEYNLSREFPYPPRGHGSALAVDKLQGKGKPKVQSKRHEAA